jgi:hypothetical protein
MSVLIEAHISKEVLRRTSQERSSYQSREK